jgi:hypothetical protein
VSQTDETNEAPSSEPADDDGADSQKKERVLHTRIPAVLEAELKAAAAALRIPVSNLVRTILEDAVAIADRASSKVEDRLTRAAQSVHDERDRLRSKISVDPFERVVAFQKVTMAAGGECAKCHVALVPGEEAALAVLSRPGPALFVCPDCMPRRDAAKPPTGG